MYLKSSRFSIAHCRREHSVSIDKKGDVVLVLHDISMNPLLRALSLGAGGIITAIDRADRTIKRTWTIGAFAWHSVYSLDDYATVSIQDKSRLIEGYQLPFFSIYLAGRGRHIKIYSTDDAEEAKAIQGKIADFLKIQNCRHE